MTDILVVGARGRVGREVVRSLAVTGASVRGLVTSEAAIDGAHTIVGNLRDRESLGRALDGCDRLFFVTPHTEDEATLGKDLVDLAVAAGVRRIVFASAFHPDFDSALGFSLFVGLSRLLTHYGPKLQVEAHVRRCKASPVVLMPSNFYQNDELLEAEIRAGLYAQPLGIKGVNRVDCRDIGDAAARALTDDSIESGAYAIVGPERALTGPECAATWARALGRDVSYDGDIDRWYALMAGRMQPRERDDFRRTYKLFKRWRVPAGRADVARATEILGRPPRSYVDYVAERVRT